MRWRDKEQRLQSYPTRRSVVEARPGIGWKRDDEVLKAAGSQRRTVSDRAEAVN